MKKLFTLCAVIVFALLLVAGCAAPAPTPTPEPAIPAHFVTYTEENIFSISYPPDWEPALSLIEEMRKFVDEWLENIEAGTSLEGEVNTIFFAGLPTETGYSPNVNIGVSPLPAGLGTLDEVVEANIRGIKDILGEDYQEFSRVKTTIDGREAVIVDAEVDLPDLGRFRNLTVGMLKDKVSWVVTCTAYPEEFSHCEDDFQAIVRSLRILR